jgi:hypothetical protein
VAPGFASDRALFKDAHDLIAKPRTLWRIMRGDDGSGMVEILFMAQLLRNPLQAIARRWWCRSLTRASRGQRRCRECTKS